MVISSTPSSRTPSLSSSSTYLISLMSACRASACSILVSSSRFLPSSSFARIDRERAGISSRSRPSSSSLFIYHQRAALYSSPDRRSRETFADRAYGVIASGESSLSAGLMAIRWGVVWARRLHFCFQQHPLHQVARRCLRQILAAPGRRFSSTGASKIVALLPAELGSAESGLVQVRRSHLFLCRHPWHGSARSCLMQFPAPPGREVLSAACGGASLSACSARTGRSGDSGVPAPFPLALDMERFRDQRSDYHS